MTDARTKTRVDNSEVVTPRLSEQQKIAWKPVGLWYSVDRGWEEWCESQSYGTGKYSFAVELGDENILFIQGATELDSFNSRYATSRYVDLPDRYNYIDWPVIAQEYDGIEIAPYIWERRLDGPAGWYYSWDCASGCIWRPKGVRVILQRKQENPDKVLDSGTDLGDK